MHAQTEHFDIYYDKSTEALLPTMSRYLEGAWKDNGEFLNVRVPGRTPFFFYSNHNEFEQTNVVPIGEGTGGVTEAFKNRLLIFNDGSLEWLRHVIYHEYGHVCQFNVLYGGFWKSARLLKSPFYPLWVMEGMAEIVAGEIDAPNGDMVVRDAIAHKKLPLLAELQGFSHVKPGQVTLAYKTGELAMKFIQDEYGYERIGDLLETLKDYFDVSSALEYLLGVDLNRFDRRFQEWANDRYRDFLARAHEPSFYGPAVTHPDAVPQNNTSPVFSPDGKKIYFFSDRTGVTLPYEYDVETKTERKLIPARYSAFEYLHSGGRGMSVSRDGRWLAFAGEKKQRDFLYLFDLTKNKLKRVRVPFDEIRYPVFSPVADTLVCVGLTRGFNDLYLINPDGKIVKRLTDNPQSERNPTFSKDGKRIVYSGEVVDLFLDDPAGWDLFSLDIAEGSVKKVVQLNGVENEPEVLPDNSIVFVKDRDQNGRYGFNLYRYDPLTTKVEQLSDFVGGGFSPRTNPVTRKILYVAFNDTERHLYEGNWVLAPPPPPIAPADVREASIAPTRILQSWQKDINEPMRVHARPYRFKASTDLFLPLIFYSSDQGLALVNLWQMSDMLGNHQFQEQAQYTSGADYLHMSLFYTYARFRPQFTIGYQTDRFYHDVDKSHYEKDVSIVGVMQYPFDRVTSMDFGVGGNDHVETYSDFSDQNDIYRERFMIAGLTYDTIQGRYLEPTQGQSVHLFYQESRPLFGGDRQYRSGGVQGVNYLRLPRESTLAARLFYGRSVGEHSQVFRLGGYDRIRGLSQENLNNKKTNILMSGVEMRYRLAYLNARTKFLFPDFFVKAAYLLAFDDFGYGWDNAEERHNLNIGHAQNSAGLGIMWPTFILQTFRLDFSIQWAHLTTTGSDVWYITVGPSF